MTEVITMKATHILAAMGLCASASIFAENADQSTINKLQQQIQTVSAQMHKALNAQQVITQKTISNLQVQVQNQITHIQAQMQQMQTQLTNEIKQVQAEVVKVSGGAAPAKAK